MGKAWLVDVLSHLVGRESQGGVKGWLIDAV